MRIDDDSPLPSDPATRVTLREVGTIGLDEFSFVRFREGIPPEVTLIQLTTESESSYTFWFFKEGADGAVVVVVQSPHQPRLLKHRVAFYERLSRDRQRRLRPDNIVRSGDCLRFVFVDDDGKTQEVRTSPVKEQGIEVRIGVDVSPFMQTMILFQAQPTPRDVSGDTVWSELLSLAPDESQVVNQVVRSFSAEVQARVRRILGIAAANGHLRLVTDKLLLCHEQLWSQTGYDRGLSDSIFAVLERIANRDS